jgi:hypothetical protein
VLMTDPISIPAFANPFRPGAGHMPPYLAGRHEEKLEFQRLLGQTTVLENLVLTGLRGVGKTVLLDSFKPMAMQANWLWVSNDFSESTSVSEETLAIRMLTDLSVVTSTIKVGSAERTEIGFGKAAEQSDVRLTFDFLRRVFDNTPGLVADKLTSVLDLTWSVAAASNLGIVFAYDEAQNLSDHGDTGQYPLSVLLQVFQSTQKRGMRFMLVLTGLPTLFPRLVEARTFTERMFRVLFLSRLSDEDSRDAILKPIDDSRCPVKFDRASVDLIARTSAGYPYFIQYICRDCYDAFLSNLAASGQPGSVPMDSIIRKLDSDFFAGRWARATDRQRDLLGVIARLPTSDDEFTVQELVDASAKWLNKPFSSSHANQMLAALGKAGLVYKNRHGRYSFAVPLFGEYVLRQIA